MNDVMTDWSNSQSTPRHYPALDGLRGTAALLIVLHHFLQLAPIRERWLTHIAALWGFAWVGVDLFFVLSGFLITGILADAKFHKHYFSSFYARRVLRIFPLYYAVLVVVLLILPRMGIQTGIPDSGPYFWVYASNFYFARYGWGVNFLSHLWTLAIEEQFYFLWPLILYFARTLEGFRKGLLWAFVGVSMLRIILHFCGMSYSALFFSSATHCDGLLLGGYLALSIRSTSSGAWKGLRPPRFLAAILIVAAYLLTNYDGFGAQWEQSSIVSIGRNFIALPLLAILFMWLIYAAIGNRKTRIVRFFSHRVLRWFGKYSYALYILHVPLAFFVLISPPGWISSHRIVAEVELFFLYFGTCSLAAFLSWHLYEKHFLRLKRYFRTGRDVLVPPDLSIQES